MNSPVLKRVIRLDNLPLGQTFYTEEGYLRDRPILTRVGIFEYTNPDGSIRRELRLPEDVFSPTSLASYKGKPIIITHDAGLVDVNNVHEEAIGTILSEGYRSGNDVRADIVIHDTEAMKDSKMKELSLGYSLDLEETPGEWEGQPYDAIQRNILINHLALVDEARAGEKARLNIDGRGSKNNSKGGKDMKTRKKARTDGILSAEELEQAIAEYKASRAAAEGVGQDGDEEIEEKSPAVEPETVIQGDEPEEEQTVVEAADEETVEEQVEEIKAANKDADPDMQKLFDIIDSLLAERAFQAADSEEEEQKEEVLADCDTVPGRKDDDDDPIPSEEKENEDENDDPVPSEDTGDLKPGEVLNADSMDKFVSDKIQVGMIGAMLNLDGLESMPLMAAKKVVVKVVRPSLNLDGKSKAYVDAAFDLACSEIKKNTRKDTAYQKRQMFGGKTRKDSASEGDSALSARARMIARQQKKQK